MAPARRFQSLLTFFNSSLSRYETEKPYMCLVPLTQSSDSEQTNVEYEQRNVNFTDIRGRESEFNLDRHGFKLILHDTTFNAFLDGRRTVKEYYPEIQDIVRKELGAEKVYVYDHTVRILAEFGD